MDVPDRGPAHRDRAGRAGSCDPVHRRARGGRPRGAVQDLHQGAGAERRAGWRPSWPNGRTTGPASPAICTSRCATATARRCSTTRTRRIHVGHHALVRRRPAGADAGTARDGRLHGELLYAPDPRLLGADRRHLGNREPHLRAARHSRRPARASASSTGSPPPTSTRTSRSPRRIGSGLWGIENRIEPSEPINGNAYATQASARTRFAAHAV